MINVYEAKQKSGALWFIEGPNMGEPGDTYCISETEAKDIVSYMNHAYNRGYKDCQFKMAKKLDNFFELGLLV